MKPFPEAVQRAFPCTSGRVPERPWWCKAVDYESYYHRVDGSVYVVRPKGEQIGKIDAERPLPHPGYRAGQIWATEDGSSAVVTQVTAYPHGWSIRAGQTSYWHTGEEFQEVYIYLIADPACPHLAPWSPVEEK